MRCFFCENITDAGTHVVLPERESQHLFKTLRGRSGDVVMLIDGRGTVATAGVGDGKRLSVMERNAVAEPEVKIHLFISPPKHNKMDQLLTQCCETGVWSITFVIADHSVVRPEEGAVPERWNVHLIEGCKQSKNPFLPVFGEVISFSGMIEKIRERRITAFYGSVEKQESGFGKAGISDAAWIVGPEGGFSPAEEERMKASGFMPLNIGRWVMRVETAAIAGSVILTNCGAKC
ncbi:MAG: RsmE family RNA methyltransferase [Victivallales bacterium]|jgi:16S rRNA (uracil1498-N3)-methyltransferase